MSVSYPLSIPDVRKIKKMVWRPRSAVGVSESPFSFAQQVYAHQGDQWQVDVDLVPMERTAAERWAAMFLALNNREGTFMLGDPKAIASLGTWSGSVKVRGGSQTGRTLRVKNGAPFATALAGDWFQLGSGSSSRLHKVTQAMTFDSGGEGSLEIWPRLRASPAADDILTLTSPRGLFRLASNEARWDVETIIYGLSFSAMEAL